MLPFTADVLFSSFEQYNRAFWPLPIVACILALATILLTLRPVRFGDQAMAMLLAAAWLWIGITYYLLRWAKIDFAAPVYGVIFVVEGLLIAWTGVVRGRLTFRFRPDLFGWIGLVMAIAAMAAFPLGDWLTGQGWQSVRLVGLAPGPTAAFTLGLLLLTKRRTPLRLAVAPLLWSLVAGATAWILPIPQDLILPITGVGGFGLILWRNRWQRRR
jgi:hypothetical protein